MEQENLKMREEIDALKTKFEQFEKSAQKKNEIIAHLFDIRYSKGAAISMYTAGKYEVFLVEDLLNTLRRD